MKPPALIAITPRGRALAHRLAASWPGAEVFAARSRTQATEHGTPRAPEHLPEHLFEDAAATLRAVFVAGRPLVAICAAGIVVRTLAPVLRSKRHDPPVVAVAEDGSAVVPLLGGHRGGHLMAERIAQTLGITAAITAAGDRRLGVALDAPPPGYRLANPQHCKSFTASLLAGAAAHVEGRAPWLREALPSATAPGAATHTIRITVERDPGAPHRLVYHPAVLAVGLGCERGADGGHALALIRDTLAAANLAEGAVASVVSLDLKADEDAVHHAARALDVPARFFTAARLEEETPRLATPSRAVFRAVGCHGVAEAAALAACGVGGRLVEPKAMGNRITCAVAMSDAPLDPGGIGRPRGELVIVGLGPGAPQWRSHEADASLAACSDLVGYEPYLDMLGVIAAGKRRHPYPIGAEVERVQAAFNLAAQGRSVALVCSGDPGIYAMASLVFEQLDNGAEPSWRRVAVRVLPGISALQAAAARSGAPLGHDFAAISLSDALTPWPVIASRLAAAAAAGFAIALYNPSAAGRRARFAQAVDILRRTLGAQTPIVLARNLCRGDESVMVVSLEELAARDDLRAQVDMFTVVLVGNGTTRRFTHGAQARVYTPRGYATSSRRAARDGTARVEPVRDGIA